MGKNEHRNFKTADQIEDQFRNDIMSKILGSSGKKKTSAHSSLSDQFAEMRTKEQTIVKENGVVPFSYDHENDQWLVKTEAGYRPERSLG